MEQDLGHSFRWWIGVVESRQDPKLVGRCQVRIAGSHTDQKTLLPTEDLPWAQPMIPLNDTASMQIKEGDYVMGFYLDGASCQVPIIMGILPGIPVALLPPAMGFSDPRTTEELSQAPKKPKTLKIASSGKAVTITEGTAVRNPSRLKESTLPRLARNETIDKTPAPVQFKKDSVFKAIPTAAGKTWNEPATPYAAVYPYNRVMETESGHILEFDDTPGAERIHIYHRSGTFEEYHPNGTKVTRINADAYEVVLSDKHIYINGDFNITAKNDINIKAGNNLNIEAVDVKIKASGSVLSQAMTSQVHFSTGPMSLSGVPLDLNKPGEEAPLGAPGKPLAVTVDATSVAEEARK